MFRSYCCVPTETPFTPYSYLNQDDLSLFIHQMLRVAPIQRMCEPARGRRASRAPGRARTPRRRPRGTGPRPCSRCWPMQGETCHHDINPKKVSVRHKLDHITVGTLVVVEPGVWVIVVQRRKGFPSAITSKAFTSCSSR